MPMIIELYLCCVGIQEIIYTKLTRLVRKYKVMQTSDVIC